MSRMGSSRLWGKIAVLIAVCGWGLSARAKYAGGSGTEAEPFRISAVSDWQELMATPADWGGQFILTSDIDLNGVSLTPIAPDTSTYSGFQGTPFTGVFDGNGCVVRNADVNMPGSDYVGLFGYLGMGGQIRNLGVEDISVFGRDDVGGLVGLNYGTISDTYSTGSVTARDDSVGGLVGSNGGTIIISYSTGSVAGEDDVGGLVGLNWGAISNCYSTASVTGDSFRVGGLVGASHEGTISNCYSTGCVSGDSYVGGLVGENDGAISNCYSTGSVTGTRLPGTYYDTGGLVGVNDGTITNCYSTGSVSGDRDVGGLVGDDFNAITGSFWDVNTSGWTTSAGGTGKTTGEMQDVNTFLEAGWDFVGETANGTWNFWLMPASGGYPVLSTFNGYIPPEPPGRGSEADPYIISDANDLATVWYRPSACYVMGNDIDLAGISWSGSVVPFFSGVFNGNDYVIRGADVNMPWSNFAGVFGYLGPNGQIRNLGVEDIFVFGRDDVGGLVGRNNYGSVSNCRSTGFVRGVFYSAGGLCGRNWVGTISGCYSAASVVNDTYHGGGLVGWNTYGTITNCYSTGSVSGDWGVGGLVGYNANGTISHCYSTGSVSGDSAVGGLVGWTEWGDIGRSFWDVNTSGRTTSAGGTPKTTAEMKTQGTFTDAAWDFIGETAKGTEDIWRMCVDGVDYPRLTWEYVQSGDFACPNGVNGGDLKVLCGDWLSTYSQALYGADANGDKQVTFADFAILAEHWLSGL